MPQITQQGYKGTILGIQRVCVEPVCFATKLPAHQDYTYLINPVSGMGPDPH